ncbi:hypothetical protein ISS85_00490 [Candidatus Microgenomates bacterium]|nr:hypothetical protein [Candidatus Microgenomates bacterium]
MYNFKKFTKTSSRTEDRISVTSSYSFGFPRKFYKDNNIGKFKFVSLYYDKKNKAVGFQFTNDEEERHKFSIIKSKKNYGGGIVATSFFKTNDLNPRDYKGKYEWQKQKIENVGVLFIIDLKKKDQEGLAPEKS